jgi:hypothetical protein
MSGRTIDLAFSLSSRDISGDDQAIIIWYTGFSKSLILL